MGILRRSSIFRRAALGGLSADPGDVDTFVREIADATIPHIERAFEKADLEIGGRPLTAYATARRIGPTANAAHLVSTSRRGWAYAWFTRQFVRGATGMDALTRTGLEEQVPYSRITFNHPIGAEARLGLDLWHIGRRVDAAAQEEFARWDRKPSGEWGAQSGDYRRLRDRARETIRERLNWPKLPADYDPPPPSKWPKDEF